MYTYATCASKFVYYFLNRRTEEYTALSQALKNDALNLGRLRYAFFSFFIFFCFVSLLWSRLFVFFYFGGDGRGKARTFSVACLFFNFFRFMDFIACTFSRFVVCLCVVSCNRSVRPPVPCVFNTVCFNTLHSSSLSSKTSWRDSAHVTRVRTFTLRLTSYEYTLTFRDILDCWCAFVLLHVCACVHTRAKFRLISAFMH